MVPSVSQRPGSIVRPADPQVAPAPEAPRASPRALAEPVSTALESAERVTAASRTDGAPALERAVSIQQVAGYDWRLSPDGKALFLTRPKPPERPDQSVAPYMLRDVEAVYYRDKADMTPDRADVGAAPSSPPAPVAPARSAPQQAPALEPPRSAPPPEPPPALRFKEADASL